MSSSSESCLRCGEKVTWIVVGLNTAIFAVKFFVALLSSSRSLLADSFQSLANLIISLIVLASLKIAGREPDEDHPYGHGNIEFIASGVVNLLLLLGALVFLVFSIVEMMEVGVETAPDLIAVLAAIFSIIGNRLASGYGLCAGRRLKSPAIMANARVNQADVWTSCAVIVAVVGANLGWPSLDHIVGIFIGLVIVHMAVVGLWDSVSHMMDQSSGLKPSEIRTLARGVEGVVEIGDIKTRLVGRKVWVDLEARVPGGRALAEGIRISRELERVLIRGHDEIARVAVRLVPAGEEA